MQDFVNFIRCGDGSRRKVNYRPFLATANAAGFIFLRAEGNMTQKQAASGISKKVKRAFGIGVTGLSESEKRIRKALKDEVLGKAKLYDKSVEAYVLPGFGLHAGFPSELQVQIEIPAKCSTFSCLRRPQRPRRRPSTSSRKFAGRWPLAPLLK